MKFLLETVRSIQLWLTISALTLAPLFFGSVDPLWVVIWSVVLSISTLCGLVIPVAIGQNRIILIFLAVCCAYALVAIVQVVPNLIGPLADPIWQRASGLLNLDLAARISSRAEISPAVVGHFLLLVTSFLSGMFVGTSRRSSDIVMEFARYSILLYAIYGLAALTFTPNMVLWAPKLAYFGFLTTTFVNHNTAATLVGAGTILWLCSAYLSFQSLNSSSIRLLLLIPSNEKLAFKLMFRSAAGLTCFFAVLLTGSRGGLICTCVGLLVAIGLMVSGKIKVGLWYVFGSAIAAFALLSLWLTGMGRIGSQGLLDGGRWVVYESCLKLIRERPLLGTGAGTFADLFPSLRTDELSSWGVWDYAHSTLLEIAVEMGIPIAAAVVIAAAASLFILGRSALRSRDWNRGALSAITGIAVLSYLHSTIDFSLQVPGYLVVFGIILGCGLARATSDRKVVGKGPIADVPLSRSTNRPQ
ncbi:O-antigen ligase family protein [Bradyrhizobium sp. WSM 1791]|uniref:O-antigen ligase family protein n=1 Tax=Bradyrhizobium australiense TaxID=2721161 RepID=A0A7Y4GXT8_9BRAD|nr:O-antigen ligase family protein [Bradyrhizobium australiense]